MIRGITGTILRGLREDRSLAIGEVEAMCGIDATLISRIENGRRLPTAEQILRLSEVYGVDTHQLMLERESDKLLSYIEYPEQALEALKIAEKKVQYGARYLTQLESTLYTKPLGIEQRRYIGSKSKLTDWIMGLITREATAKGTFVDLFSGTGVMAKRALEHFDEVVINDFLHSNNVIYKAFFGEGEWNRDKLIELLDYFNHLNPNDLPDNYFSTHFGDKYYEESVARHIGHIRNQIEEIRPELTIKEYNILLTTLIYNIDRLANTVGHFEAYIKKPISPRPLTLRLIDAHSYPQTTIYQRDANELAKEVKCDVVYMDPPYNSRQYCRFYHLYETLVKWDEPELYGIALKPAPENMSKYCTTRAVDAFRDVVSTIDARYIVVSYNNTYNSKSNSSENKIRLEDIESILNACGETKVFSQSHQAFNAGKTEFDDHKELLFITKVDHEKRSKAFAPLLCW